MDPEPLAELLVTRGQKYYWTSRISCSIRMNVVDSPPCGRGVRARCGGGAPRPSAPRSLCTRVRTSVELGGSRCWTVMGAWRDLVKHSLTAQNGN